MSRKKHKHRRGAKAAEKPSEKTAPGAASRRRRPHKKRRGYSRATVVAAAVVAIVGAAILMYGAWQSQSASLSFGFDDRRTVQEWNVQRGETTPHGIRLEPTPGKGNGNAFLISPKLKSPGGGGARWRDFPYFRIKVTPEDRERVMHLLWIPGEDLNKNRNRPFTLPATADEVLVDVRQRIPWQGAFGWDEPAFGGKPIGRVGVLTRDAVEIRRIDLPAALNPLQLVRLMWAQYWTYEPIRVNSINIHYGNEVTGTPVTALFGGTLVVLFVLMWIARRKSLTTALLWGMFACLALATAPFNVTLWNHAEASSKVSAWHADRYDEYRSRFGEEFADLDKEFLKHVPEGSRVSFPASQQWLVEGETNWIWFLYYGLYENYRDRKSDSTRIGGEDEYVFYYHPGGMIHDERENVLRYADKERPGTYKTQTLARVSQNAKILKLIRD